MPENTVALYVAVTALDDPVVSRLDHLRRDAACRGWRVVAEFVDHSAPWRQDRRPALRRLMRAADGGAFRNVLVPDLAHFACSASHVVSALFTFARLGIRFVTADESIDTGTVEGAAMLALTDAIARLQREILDARVRQIHARRDSGGRAPRHLHLVSRRSGRTPI